MPLTVRTLVRPPRRQLLGDLPNCAPYYDQLRMPTALQPGQLAPAPPQDLRQRFHAFNSIIAPVAGTSLALITSYVVPAAHLASIVGIMLQYIGTPAPPPEGDATQYFFSVRLNSVQMVPFWSNIPNTLGNFDNGPWPVPGKLNLFASDLVEVLVTVPGGSTIATGSPNRFHAHLLGYYWPNS